MIVTAFHRQFPKVKVRVTEGAIDSIVPALMAGEIDLACVTLSFPSQPELVKEPLVGVRHALVARAEHPLAGKGTVKAEDLGALSLGRACQRQCRYRPYRFLSGRQWP